MNKLKTTGLGGFPVVLDDFRWMDAGYRDGFYGLLAAFGVEDDQSFVIVGCERSVDDGTVTVSPGYVSINGEVCFFPEQTYDEPTTETEFFEVAVSYDAEGLKTFQDASEQDTYEIRRAKISISDTPPIEHTNFLEVQTIMEIIHDLLPSKANIYHVSFPPPPPGILFNTGDIVVASSTIFMVVDGAYVLLS